jgi:hypothetical protein
VGWGLPPAGAVGAVVWGLHRAPAGAAQVDGGGRRSSVSTLQAFIWTVTFFDREKLITRTYVMCPWPHMCRCVPGHNSWRVFRTRVTFIICDSCYREVSQICFHIGDASSENASHFLFVTRFVNQRHEYYNLSVTRLDNTCHIFYLWRVLLTHVTNTSLLVTRLAPGSWATTNRWRVSWTRVTDRLLVTRFVFVSRIVVSLITFSGIVSQQPGMESRS